MKFVWVSWADAASTDEWVELEGAKAHGLVEVQTVGILINETDECIVIALSKNMHSEHVSNFISIPKGWIKDRKELKLPRSRKSATKPGQA